MNTSLRISFLQLLLSLLLTSVGLLVPFHHLGAQNTSERAPASTNATKKTTAKAPPSTQEITDAKAKGLVWVNTATRVYHKDGPSYGTTKRGKFLTEEDAKKAGFRMASDPGSKKVHGQ